MRNNAAFILSITISLNNLKKRTWLILNNLKKLSLDAY